MNSLPFSKKPLHLAALLLLLGLQPAIAGATTYKFVKPVKSLQTSSTGTTPTTPTVPITPPVTPPVTPPAVPTAELSTTLLTFNAQTSPTLAGTSTAQAVRLSNKGNAELRLSPPQLTGAAEFSSVTNCGTVLAPSGYCDTSVTYAPTSAAPANATLTFQTALGNTAVSISGTPVLPPASSSLDGNGSFGTVELNSTNTRTFTIRNTSTYTPLEVTSVTASGEQVSWVPAKTGIACSGTTPFTIQPGQSCSVDLTWKPITAGTLAGAALTVVDSTATGGKVNLTGTALPPADPYFANVTLLMPFEGNGDIKGNTVTNYGAVISSAQKYQGNSSFNNPGTAANQVMRVENAALFDFPGDFTIEGFVMPTATAGVIFDIGGISGLNWQSQSLNIVNGKLNYSASSANNGADIAQNLDLGSVAVNTWTHYAITRNGAIYRFFNNGKLVQTVSVNKKPYTPAYGLIIGGYANTSWANVPIHKAIYLDEFRITKGVARYTADFTVPTTAFPTR